MIYVQLITTLRSITTTATTATTAPAIVDEDIVNANRQKRTHFHC